MGSNPRHPKSSTKGKNPGHGRMMRFFSFPHKFPCGYARLSNNVSSVVAFQRWWVLKSKLFAQESTPSEDILILTTLNHL